MTAENAMMTGLVPVTLGFASHAVGGQLKGEL